MKQIFLTLVFLLALGVVGCESTRTATTDATVRVSYRPNFDEYEISAEIGASGSIGASER